MEQSYYRHSQKSSYLKRFYFLVQLKRAKMPFSDLVLFYTTCVRSILTYALPVFHHALVKYLKVELEGIQKRALAIICPNIAYNNALDFLGIPKITTYNEAICDTVKPRLSGPPLSEFLDCPYFFSGPNLVMNIY